ncbi:MAG: superoxide dismutase [Phycisphaeraceae bacterium]|nr:MAG: superoxide dismutase [Phycisphaeraceae bacterium]
MSDTAIDRRTALGTIAGAAALGAFAARSAASLLSPAELGWNAESGEYDLPPLPYGYDALEPSIDEQTMRIHHDKHHAGYVKGLNKAVTELRKIREGQGDLGLIKHWSRELSFHGSGHVNHSLFWAGMAPAGQGGGGYPEGELAKRIDRDFGTFEQFVGQFKAAANAVEGSGWGWLVHDPMSGHLHVLQAEKHQNLTMTGVTPLLGVDVWEHAYYLKYQNRRGDYLDAFMNVVNWPEIGRRYAAAVG